MQADLLGRVQLQRTNFTGPGSPCYECSYYDVKAGSNEPKLDQQCGGWTARLRAAGDSRGESGATWDSLWAGNATGSYNAITPRFTNASLSDQFRPNDRFLINASIRYDNFTYDMPNSATSANEFYANMTANYTCVLAATNEVLT